MTVVIGPGAVDPGALLGTVWLQDYGPKPGVLSSDDATWTAAINDWVAIAAGSLVAFPNAPLITGFGGLYTLSKPLVLPAGCCAGNFGGGVGLGAIIQGQQTAPTVTGVCSAVNVGSQTLTVNHIKKRLGVPLVFPTASPSSPQPFICFGGTYQYTGVSGSGSSVTLTGVTGTFGSALVTNLVGGYIVAGAQVLCAGHPGNNGYQLDRTIYVAGTSSEYVAFGSTTTGTVTPGTSTTVAMAAVPTDARLTSGGLMCIVGPTCDYQFQYTGVSGGAFTGVTWLNSGAAITSPASVYNVTPPNGADGVFVGSGGAVDCYVGYHRHGFVMMTDHERLGPHAGVSPSSCFSNLCFESPDEQWVGIDSGSQSIDTALYGAQFANVYITDKNAIIAATFDSHSATGSTAPWHFYKEATVGVSGAAGATNGVMVYNTSFEAPGLGLVGCPDCGAAWGLSTQNCFVDWDGAGTTAPGGIPPVAEFSGQSVYLNDKAGNLFSTPSPEGYPNTPYFKADLVVGQTDSSINTLAARTIIGMAPSVLYNHPIYQFEAYGGIVVGSNYPGAASGMGDLTVWGGQVNVNWPGIQITSQDPGSGYALAGFAVAPFAGASGRLTGPLAVNKKAGTVAANMHTVGDVTVGSTVVSNGAVSPGTIKNGSTDPCGYCTFVSGTIAYIWLEKALG